MSILYKMKTLYHTSGVNYVIPAGLIYGLFMSVGPFINLAQREISLLSLISTLLITTFAYSMLFAVILVGLFIGVMSKIYLSIGFSARGVVDHYRVLMLMFAVYCLLGILTFTPLWIKSSTTPLIGYYFGVAASSQPLKFTLILALFLSLVALFITNLLGLALNIGNLYGSLTGTSTGIFSLALLIYLVPRVIDLVQWMAYWQVFLPGLVLMTGGLFILNQKLLYKAEVKK